MTDHIPVLNCPIACHRALVRTLLRQGIARVHGLHPFTIVLIERRP